ncbi:hypothetical protein NDU88_006422 [Pleurodeles waltl]|uniref:Uncharacterized protein n=1 Tax=Pleurodeles waltl TaxID=8319 RepID=A0AAV7VLW0_PLEWA|nr:hypothetical protein NDU88_006422 [Pleurodeles waltl]
MYRDGRLGAEPGALVSPVSRHGRSVSPTHRHRGRQAPGCLPPTSSSFFLPRLELKELPPRGHNGGTGRPARSDIGTAVSPPGLNLHLNLLLNWKLKRETVEAWGKRRLLKPWRPAAQGEAAALRTGEARPTTQKECLTSSQILGAMGTQEPPRSSPPFLHRRSELEEPQPCGRESETRAAHGKRQQRRGPPLARLETETHRGLLMETGCHAAPSVRRHQLCLRLVPQPPSHPQPVPALFFSCTNLLPSAEEWGAVCVSVYT